MAQASEDQLRRWLFEFKLNGFIMFRNLLPGDLIDGMNAQFKEFLSLEIEMDRRGQPMSGRGKNRYAVRLDTMLDKVGGPLNDPLARRNPLIEELVTAIVGPWRHGKLIVECPCKGSEHMGWHNDALAPHTADLPAAKRTDQLKFHIPLIDVTETNGPMELIPGSHRMYYFEGDEAVKGLSTVYSTRILTAKGDCFLRDADLVHRGTPNLSDEPRPLYSQIYKAVE